MSMRTLAASFLWITLASACPADTLTLKDGTAKKVRIYKMTKEYVSYLFEGRIEVVPRDKLKEKGGIKIEGKPATEKDLVEALKKYREELKKKVKEEEKKSGLKPGANKKVKSIVKGEKPGTGVKIIDKSKSKTKATELMIDPFPDHPTKSKAKKTK